MSACCAYLPCWFPCHIAGEGRRQSRATHFAAFCAGRPLHSAAHLLGPSPCYGLTISAAAPPARDFLAVAREVRMDEWLRGGEGRGGEGRGRLRGREDGRRRNRQTRDIRSFPPGARRCLKSASRSNPSPQVRQLAAGGQAAQRANAGAMGVGSARRLVFPQGLPVPVGAAGVGRDSER